MSELKAMQVIYCTKELRGTGKNSLDPIRIIPQIYNLDGSLIMEEDSLIKYTEADMMSFAAYLLDRDEDDITVQLIEDWKESLK